MNEVVMVGIAVDAEAAEALKDETRRARVGRLVSRIARLYQGKDAMAEVLERTSRRAQATV